MRTNYKRTIQDVLNFETGEEIKADTFFNKPLDELSVFRSELQKAIKGFREPLFTCFYCKQLIRIRGGIGNPTKRKVDTFHFAHLKDSADCPVKTDSKLSKEEVDRIKYQGARESILHVTLKHKIAECLSLNQNSKGEVSAIQVEKVINNRDEKEWKKPDINAFFRDKRIAIELQLSTTWLDVITGRQKFYEDQKIFILWLFHHFNPNDDSRLLTYNDVIYTNNQNAYVFDDETYRMSFEEKDLVLRCWYKTYSIRNEMIKERWEYKYNKLSDLIFKEDGYKLFYHDTAKQKVSVHDEYDRLVENNRIVEQERQRNIRIAEEKRKKDIQEKKQKENDLRALKAAKCEELNFENDRLKNLIQIINGLNVTTSETANILQSIEYYTDRILDQLPKTYCYLPFIKDEVFLTDLKDTFAEKLREATITINEKQQEQNDLKVKLQNIKSLEDITIGGYSYKKLVMPRDWEFVKGNQKLVKIIKKEEVGHLFETDYLYEISSDHMLYSLKNRTDLFVLIDFSQRIESLQHQTTFNNELIKTCFNTIKKLREEITAKLTKFIIELSTELKSKIEVKQSETDFCKEGIQKLEREIQSIDHQISSIN